MGRYIGTSELQAYLFGTTGTIAFGGGTITPTQQALMGTAINNAEAAIDSYTRRNFAGTAGTVYYSRFTQAGNVRGQALYLDGDLYSLVGVVNGDSQVIPTGSVWLEPRNEGPPYRIVRLRSSYVWTWNTDSDLVLSGTWGYSVTPPADIQQAAVRLAAYLYRLKDTGVADVSGYPEAGEVTLPKGLPDDVRLILERYRSRSGGAI
jgi:hypothetical protein